MNELLVADLNAVRTLTLNRPEVFNSFNQSMALKLITALDDASVDDSVRAIVLTGSGKAFSAGQDLAEITDPQGPPLTDIIRKHYNPIIERIRAIEKPIIASVNGVAAGAGANIALACDITLAKHSASFIQAFSKIGLIPDSGGTFFLPRLIGQQKAAALMMTGEKITAQQAEQMNMIYRACPDEDFSAEVVRLAEKLAQMPTKALGLTKKALNKSALNSLTEQLELEAEFQIQASKTEDFQTGVQAFLSKKIPEFKGK